MPLLSGSNLCWKYRRSRVERCLPASRAASIAGRFLSSLTGAFMNLPGNPVAGLACEPKEGIVQSRDESPRGAEGAPVSALSAREEMSGMKAAAPRSSMVVEIGGMAIRLRCGDPAFIDWLTSRYAGYVGRSDEASFDFEIELAPAGRESGNEDLSVSWDSGCWLMERGDFRAEWNPSSGRGRVQQAVNPYSLDSVLRIMHTLLLAPKGGFLVHASSAVRNGRAFLFSGVSGAGKTTIASLAPPDAHLLTDEISYVTREDGRYFAVGTPFFGELGRVGENLRAPIECVYLLAKGPENKIESIGGPDALRGLLGNVLFFARDTQSVKLVFDAAFEFVSRVPVRRLTFVPDERVWDWIA